MKGALVTGAGMRVGRALAMALAADGFFVFVHYNRSAGPARETVAAIVAAGGKAKAVRADLSSARQAEALVGKCRAPRRAAHLPGEQRLAVQARPRADGQGGGLRSAHGGQSPGAAAALPGAGAATAGRRDRRDREHARPEAVQPQSRLPDLHAVQGRPAGTDDLARPGLRAAAQGGRDRARPHLAQRQPDRRPLRPAAHGKSLGIGRDAPTIWCARCASSWRRRPSPATS